MTTSLTQQRALAFIADVTLLLLPALSIVFLSAYFLPPDLRQDYLLLMSKTILLLLILFYYLIQFLPSLFSPTPGQRIFAIRRVSSGPRSSFVRFFIPGALPMSLFVLFLLWPLIFLPLVSLFLPLIGTIP